MREENVERLNSAETHIGHPHFLVYRALFRALTTAAQQAHGALLDIGCGNKPYEGLFAGKISSYTGCDIVQSSKRCVDILCPATQIPVESGSFDTVLTTQVIEHVEDHQALIAESYRVLRPNGILLLSGPMYWPLHEEPYDYFRFTKYGFRYLLNKFGYEVLDVIPNGGRWALAGQALIHAFASTRYSRPFFVAAINRIFAWLDDHKPDSINTMNYVVIARKPEQ